MTRTRVAKMTDEVFWSLVRKSDGCWIWSGSLTKGGYGKAGRRGYAHIVAYRLTVGPVPNGMQLDHLCRVRRCVRPSHLDPVTCRENLLRGKTLAAANAAKTHCPAGHAYDTANTHLSPQGRRKCRICMADESKRTYARRNARRSPTED